MRISMRKLKAKKVMKVKRRTVSQVSLHLCT